MKLCRFILWLSLCFCLTATADNLLVVTRVDSDIGSLTSSQLKQLWLKQALHINDVGVEIADLAEKHPIRALYYQNVVEKSGNKLSAYWSIRVFRGEGFPPPSFESEQVLIDWLVSSQNRLGYIDSANMSEKLKSVFIIKYDKSEAKE